MAPSFAHLRAHSDYSLGQGASKVKDLVKAAAALGQPALAVVDVLNMHGAMETAKYAKDAGVQPITGATVRIEIEKGRRGSLILLAQDETGYSNICQVVKKALSPGADREARDALGYGELQALGDAGRLKGVIALAGCGGEGIVDAVLAGWGADFVPNLLDNLKGLFGENLYAEICRNAPPTAAESEAEQALVAAADALDVPLVATTDVWYVSDAQHDAFAILKAVAANAPASIAADEVGILHEGERRFRLRSDAEMRELFADLPDAYEAALTVARRCAFAPGNRKPILPPFQTSEGRTEAEELRAQSEAGLEARLAALGPAAGFTEEQYRERLAFELDVIIGMKFPGYFLIVSDFIKWAKDHGIPVGPGRGSGAGSVVAWALLITDLDPLRFGLLFERFLNPDRVSMPDFDVDFCQDRRGEVIEYVKIKYGTDLVAQIATFTGLKSKGAFRDAARVVRHAAEGALSQREVNGITGLIPKDKENPADPAKLEVAYALAPEFQARIDETPRARVVYDAARKVEGLYRNASTHAAGIVIGGQDLAELVPIGFDPKTDFPVVQFNMKFAESAGLVKFDFLGLKTLSVIRLALDYIEETTGDRPDLSKIPLDDADTFKMLARADATAVFQFESPGMRGCLRDMRASAFEDLVAAVSLYRPGPMAMIPTYCDCKIGRSEPDYPEPADKTRPILAETYGIMVYQEQVMAVARAVAGYSLGQADLLRRAMGKKIKAEMDAQKEGFIKGAEGNGVAGPVAAALFDKIAHFASYGFNKSHAAAYALVSYHTAWLKAHYPAQYLSAFLSYEEGPEKVALVKQDLDARGIPLLAPCIQRSRVRFAPEVLEGGRIGVRYGLASINGISDTVRTVVEERVANGPFASLEDLHSRAGKAFNSAQIAKLASTGAFDVLCPVRQRAHDVMVFLGKNDKGDRGADLFGGTAKVTVPPDILEKEEWPNAEVREFEVLKVYLRQHPLERDMAVLMRAQVKRRASIEGHMRSHNIPDLVNKKLYGFVEEVLTKTSQRGRPYLRIEVSERDDRYWLSYFCPPGEIQDHIASLKTCKENREPCAFVAKFALDDRGEYRISADSYLSRTDFLARFQGGAERVVRIDPRMMRAASAFGVPGSRQREIAVELAALDAAMTGKDDHETKAKVAAKLGELAEFAIQAIAANIEQAELPEDPRGDRIVFEVVLSDAWTTVLTRIPGWFGERRFRIDTAFHFSICQVDGVVDVNWTGGSDAAPAPLAA